VFDRNFANKEKEVDAAITRMLLEDSFMYMRVERTDRVVLVAGDRDYVPAIESLARRGFPTTVVFWEHATARDLRTQADDFTALDPLFAHISRARSRTEQPPTE